MVSSAPAASSRAARRAPQGRGFVAPAGRLGELGRLSVQRGASEGAHAVLGGARQDVRGVVYHDQGRGAVLQLLEVVGAPARCLRALREQHETPPCPRAGDVEEPPFLGLGAFLRRSSVVVVVEQAGRQFQPLIAARFRESVLGVHASDEDLVELQPLGRVRGQHLNGVLLLLLVLAPIDPVPSCRLEPSVALVQVLVVRQERREVSRRVQPCLDGPREAQRGDEARHAARPLACREEVCVGQVAAGHDPVDCRCGRGGSRELGEFPGGFDEPRDARIVRSVRGEPLDVRWGGVSISHVRAACAAAEERLGGHDGFSSGAEGRPHEQAPGRPRRRRVHQQLHPRQQILHTLVVGSPALAALLEGDALDVQGGRDPVEVEI